jgi:hypothetical protein
MTFAGNFERLPQNVQSKMGFHGRPLSCAKRIGLYVKPARSSAVKNGQKSCQSATQPFPAQAVANTGRAQNPVFKGFHSLSIIVLPHAPGALECRFDLAYN